MSFIVEDWQTTRSTVRERSMFMFNNDLFSDVKFVVRIKTESESESKQVIPAHKFVLSISSPVFEAMFYGELAETKDCIELPDCEYESLLEFFRYMYSDEVYLSGNNVMEVLYLAKKYMVPSLAEKCAEYLQDQTDTSNVFSILPFAQKYDEKTLVDRCWEVIDKHTEEAVRSDGFATIERSLLEAVIERDTLTIEEIELFKAVDLWATKECERQGLVADGAAKRKILGKEVIQGIRFPTMVQEDFISVVLDSRILTQDEISSIIKYLSAVPRTPVRFPYTKRCGFGGNIRGCCRFSSLSRLVSQYNILRYDAIKFSVDKDIALLGACLIGSKNNTHSIDFKIKNATGEALLVSKAAECPSKLLQCEKFSYYGFEVLFEKKIILTKNTTYQMWAKIRGPGSLYGVRGVSCVKCRDVIIEFLEDDSISTDFNGTGVQQGQFPELLFDFK